MIIDLNHTLRIYEDLDKLSKVILSKMKFNEDKLLMSYSGESPGS